MVVTAVALAGSGDDGVLAQRRPGENAKFVVHVMTDALAQLPALLASEGVAQLPKSTLEPDRSVEIPHDGIAASFTAGLARASAQRCLNVQSSRSF